MVSKLLPVRRIARPKVRREHRLHSAGLPRAEPGEERALTFLGEVLEGETRWRLSEVQRLLALHTLVAVGHWHADGLDQPRAEREAP